MRLNLVTYHLIFAITGLVFCGLNSVINMVFYNIQSKVKHNECNTVFLKTIFQMMLGSWLTWTILCAAGHFVVSFEQVDKSNKRLNYIAHHNTSILCQNILGPLAWFRGDLIGVLSVLYQTCLMVCWVAVIVVHFGQR